MIKEAKKLHSMISNLMICPLFQAAQDNPLRIFLRQHDQSYTFEMTEEQTQQKALWLGKHFPAQSKLAIEGDNPFEVITWLMAAARSQMIIAICSNKDPLSKLRSHLQEQKILWLNDFLLEDPLHMDLISKKDLQFSPPKIQKDLPLSILFTSGSSGSPKAVVHSFANYWNSAKISHQNIPFEYPSKWLLSLSLWHIGGLAILLRSLYGRATAIKKDPNMLMSDQIECDAITHLSLVSTQLGDLLQDGRSFQSLKAILVGGGMIHSQYLDLATTKGWPIHCTYGMTELSSQMCTTKPNSSRSILNSSGCTLGDWEIKIGDHDEILCKGSSLFLGYWNGQEILPSKDPEGYFHTGDRGLIKEDLLYIIGRKDHMFISGGENIHPEEIENILKMIFKEAIVVPIPDHRYGHRPVAFVYFEEAQSMDLPEDLLKDPHMDQKITQVLQNHLPKFKHPDRIFSWPKEIPLIKPSRAHLQKIALQL